jgi:hypothetical protein
VEQPTFLLAHRIAGGKGEALGAKLVVIHGETIVEPVAPDEQGWLMHLRTSSLTRD